MAKRGGGYNCLLSIADLIWAANSCGSCVENMLDCFCIGSGGGGNGTFGNTNNGGNNNNNNVGDKLNMDGVDPWWAEEDEQIFNELNGKGSCIFNELKN